MRTVTNASRVQTCSSHIDEPTAPARVARTCKPNPREPELPKTQPRRTVMPDHAAMVRTVQAHLASLVEEASDEVRVEETPFAGSKLYLPKSAAGPVPGIVVFHGSEGGAVGGGDLMALTLAKQGFAAMAYNYFGVPGTPKTLKLVPLERIGAAIDWLHNSAPVAGGKVGVFGASRGGELALLVASTFADKISAVAAHSPSTVAGPSVDPRTWTSDRSPSWTAEGQAIPVGTAIDTTRFAGPLLVSAGDRDELWPAAHYCGVVARQKHDAGQSAEVYVVANQGHCFDPDIEAEFSARRQAFFTHALG